MPLITTYVLVTGGVRGAVFFLFFFSFTAAGCPIAKANREYEGQGTPVEYLHVYGATGDDLICVRV